MPVAAAGAVGPVLEERAAPAERGLRSGEERPQHEEQEGDKAAAVDTVDIGTQTDYTTLDSAAQTEVAHAVRGLVGGEWRWQSRGRAI